MAVAGIPKTIDNDIVVSYANLIFQVKWWQYVPSLTDAYGFNSA